MFDNLICLAPLPNDPPIPRDDFQTKDLDCLLDTYTITEDGLLLHARWNVEGELTVPYHGLIRFYYGDWSNDDQKMHAWYEYEAKFTDGKLVEIRMLQEGTR